MGSAPDHRNPLDALGGHILAGLLYAGGMTLLFGSVLRWLLAGLFVPGVKLGRPAIATQMIRVGVHSLGIVILIQIFMGIILALQLTPPLAPYHQEKQVSVIIGVAGFRMMAPILTAVVLSGFAGASMAAELGTMVISEEIEAMEAIALNPVRYLVVPRMVATTLATVLLTSISDVMEAIGGYFTSRVVLGAAVYEGYWKRMQESLEYRDFYTGLIMAGVFGVLISLIACFEGLKVKGGAEGVGRATTMTVVYCIVSIIVAACIFTAIFYVYKL